MSKLLILGWMVFFMLSPFLALWVLWWAMIVWACLWVIRRGIDRE